MRTTTLAILSVLAVLGGCASTPKTPQSGSPPPQQTMAVAKPAPAAINITGVWTLSVETPMGVRDMKMTAMQNGEVLTGTITNPRGDSAISGTVKGSGVTFSMKVNAQGQDLQIDFSGTAESDAMKGTAQFGSFGNGTFTAKKQ